MNTTDSVTDKMTSDEPVVRVFGIKHGTDVAGIWARIIRELSDEPTVNDNGERVVMVLNTEKGRVFIKGHVLSPAKLDKFMGWAKSPNDPKLSHGHRWLALDRNLDFQISWLVRN